MNIDYHTHNWICSVVNQFDDTLLDWLAALPDEAWEQVRAMEFPRIAVIIAAQAQAQVMHGKNKPR